MITKIFKLLLHKVTLDNEMVLYILNTIVINSNNLVTAKMIAPIKTAIKG